MSRGNPYHDSRGRFASANGCKIKSEFIKEEHDSKEARDLKNMGRRFFNGEAEFNKGGEWSIGRGGYDLEYEVYHEGEPAFGCVDGEIDVYQEKYRGYAREFSKVSGDRCPPLLHNGERVKLKRIDGNGVDKADYEIVDDALDERIDNGEYNSHTSVYVRKIGGKNLFHTSIGWLEKE